jgi:uncharacterized membrane protein
MKTRTKRALLGIAAFGLLLGLGGAGYAAAPKADFSLAMSPSSASVAAGGTTTYSVTVNGSNGFKSPVTLSSSGLPAAATASFAPNPNTNSTSTLMVQTSASTPTGTYQLTITGVSGSLSHYVSASLTVTAPASRFSLSVSPASVSTAAGTVATYSVTVTRTNFTGSISFSITGTPALSSATFAPASTAGNTTSLQISTSAGTPLGSYSLTITGSSGATKASTVATLTVSASQGGRPFTISGTLDRLLAPGVTGYVNLSLANPNNQTLSVTNLTVAIDGTNRSGCTTSNFSVAQFSGTYPLTVPANSTRTLSQLGVTLTQMPAVTMIDLPVNQDICKSTGLSLGYSGTGSGG